MSYVKSQTTIGSTNATVFQCQASGEYFYSLSSVSELVLRPTNATVFQCQASGEYFYSLSSVSELVSRPTSSASDFFRSTARVQVNFL